MILESGFIVFLGLLFLGIKLPRKTSLILLGRPLALDISVSAIAYLLHFGTFSGAMVAAVAGVMTSLFTHAARKLFGYIRNGVYVHGWFVLTDENGREFDVPSTRRYSKRPGARAS